MALLTDEWYKLITTRLFRATEVITFSIFRSSVFFSLSCCKSKRRQKASEAWRTRRLLYLYKVSQLHKVQILLRRQLHKDCCPVSSKFLFRTWKYLLLWNGFLDTDASINHTTTKEFYFCLSPCLKMFVSVSVRVRMVLISLKMFVCVCPYIRVF